MSARSENSSVISLWTDISEMSRFKLTHKSEIFVVEFRAANIPVIAAIIPTVALNSEQCVMKFTSNLGLLCDLPRFGLLT